MTSCCQSLLSPQNPDIVLVHYLNVPAIEDCGKPCGPILCSINTDKKEWAKWTKEELIGQLKPMCEYRPVPSASAAQVQLGDSVRSPVSLRHGDTVNLALMTIPSDPCGQFKPHKLLNRNRGTNSPDPGRGRWLNR